MQVSPERRFNKRKMDKTMRKIILFSIALLLQCVVLVSAQELNITRITRQSDTLEIEVSLVNRGIRHKG